MTKPHQLPFRNTTRGKMVKARGRVAVKPDTTNRLLKLPPELQRMIWRHVVINADEPRTISPTSDNFSCAGWAPPALTRTCREIRYASLPLYFSQNTFLFAVNGFGPFFPILRRALTYLEMTNPGTRLPGFELKMEGHYPVVIEDLVEYARIFGTRAAQLPEGPVPLRGIYQGWCDRAEQQTPGVVSLAVLGSRAARANFTTFLQDLANVGRRLHAQGVPYSYDSYKVAVEGMFTEPGVDWDHFRRWIIQDCMKGLVKVRATMDVPAWVVEARNRGEIEE